MHDSLSALSPAFEACPDMLRYNGKPDEYLTEDPSRILLLLKASSLRNIPFSHDIDEALRHLSHLIPRPGVTRDPALLRTQFSTFLDLLCGDGIGRILREYAEIFTLLLPPLKPAVGYDQQNPHHLYTVYEHTVRAVENVPPCPELRLIMLLHDTGKPLTRTTDENGIGHYSGHQKVSASLTRSALSAWKCDPVFIDRIALLVEAHDIPLSTDHAIMKRRLTEFGEKNLRALFLIHKADRIATGTRNPKHAADRCRELTEALDKLIAQT